MTERAQWRLMTGLAFVIVTYAMTVIVVPGARPPFVRDRVVTVPWAMFPHLAASALALAVGPFQFVPSIRSRHLRLHRWIGRLYVMCVVVGGTSGLRLAFVSRGGTAAHLGFALLAILWVGSVARAYYLVRTGNTSDHRRWMKRNYSLTLAAVTLRIYLPVSLAAGVPFEMAYPAISFLCWVPNLLAVEAWFMRSTERPGLAT